MTTNNNAKDWKDQAVEHAERYHPELLDLAVNAPSSYNRRVEGIRRRAKNDAKERWQSYRKTSPKLADVWPK